MFCSFIGDKIASGHFKDEITPSLKADDKIKCFQGVALNRVRNKGKPRCKLSYKVLNEECIFFTSLDIFPYLILIQLKDSLGEIHHFVTVAGKCIFDSHFPFAITLTKDNLDFC